MSETRSRRSSAKSDRRAARKADALKCDDVASAAGASKNAGEKSLLSFGSGVCLSSLTSGEMAEWSKAALC
jgi:hypothetical protein